MPRPRVEFPIGFLTAARYQSLLEEGIRLRILHKGIDVTDRCFIADDRPESNHAWLYRLNAAGHKFEENGRAATETVLGDVQIIEAPQ